MWILPNVKYNVVFIKYICATPTVYKNLSLPGISYIVNCIIYNFFKVISSSSYTLTDICCCNVIKPVIKFYLWSEKCHALSIVTYTMYIYIYILQRRGWNIMKFLVTLMELAECYECSVK